MLTFVILWDIFWYDETKLLTLLSFGGSLTCVAEVSDGIKCVSLNNQPYQAGPTLLDVNSYELLYYSFVVNVNKCCGSCTTIDDPYARICVPNKVKNMNVKVFNLISRVNETRFLVQHEFLVHLD